MAASEYSQPLSRMQGATCKSREHVGWDDISDRSSLSLATADRPLGRCAYHAHCVKVAPAKPQENDRERKGTLATWLKLLIRMLDKLASAIIRFFLRSIAALYFTAFQVCHSVLCFSTYSSNFIGSFPAYFLVAAIADSSIDFGNISSGCLCFSAPSAKLLTRNNG